MTFCTKSSWCNRLSTNCDLHANAAGPGEVVEHKKKEAKVVAITAMPTLLPTSAAPTLAPTSSAPTYVTGTR